MAEIHSLVRPTLAVAVALWKDGKVLLAQRSKPPFEGSWSFPGGKVRPGEKLKEAALRELAEETGLAAKELGFVRPVEIILKSKDLLTHHVLIALFTGNWTEGEAKAASDAQALRWMAVDDLSSLNLTEGLENHARACWELLRKTNS